MHSATMLQQDKRYEDAFVSPAQGLDMVGRNTLLVVVDTHIPSFWKAGSLRSLPQCYRH
ncbi:MAG: hypothetical protein ACLTY5_00710 [Angelakisella sp.]